MHVHGLGVELGWATVGWATVGQAAVSWAAVSWTYVSSCLVDWLLHSNLLRLAVSWAAVSRAAVLVVTSSVKNSEFCLLGYLANVALSALQTSDICPEQWASVSHSMPSLASWVLMGTTWNRVTKRAGVILLWTVRIVISLIGGAIACFAYTTWAGSEGLGRILALIIYPCLG